MMDDKFDMETKSTDTYATKPMKRETKIEHPHTHHHPTTMDGVAEALAGDFGEEMEDAKKYLCMAKVADSAGMEEDAHYLLEMAKDEYTHAAFIHDFMERHDMWISEEHKERYHELEEKMAEFFR